MDIIFLIICGAIIVLMVLGVMIIVKDQTAPIRPPMKRPPGSDSTGEKK